MWILRSLCCVGPTHFKTLSPIRLRNLWNSEALWLVSYYFHSKQNYKVLWSTDDPVIGWSSGFLRLLRLLLSPKPQNISGFWNNIALLWFQPGSPYFSLEPPTQKKPCIEWRRCSSNPLSFQGFPQALNVQTTMRQHAATDAEIPVCVVSRVRWQINPLPHCCTRISLWDEPESLDIIEAARRKRKIGLAQLDWIGWGETS